MAETTNLRQMPGTVTNFETATEHFSTLLAHAKSSLEQASVYNLQIILETTIGNFERVIDLSLAGLQLLGEKIPTRPRAIQNTIRQEIQQIQAQLSTRDVAAIQDEPPMQSAAALAKIHLMAYTIPALYYTNTDLSNLFYLKMVTLSLQDGNTAVSAMAYLGLGRYWGEVLHDFPGRHQFGKLGLDLVERFGVLELQCNTLFLFGGFIGHWRHHAQQDLSTLRNAFCAGIESGNFIWACYANNVMTMKMVMLGTPLTDLVMETQRSLDYAQQVGELFTPTCLLSTRQFARCLQGLTAASQSFTDESFDESQHVEMIASHPGLVVSLNWYYFLKLQTLYLCQDYAQALAIAEQAETSIPMVQGLMQSADFYFYQSLVWIALFPTVDEPTQLRYRRLLQRNLKLLKKWATHCSANFQCRYTLVAAEVAWLRHRTQSVPRLYQQAIQAAKTDGYLNVYAIACERAAVFYEAEGVEVVAKAYFQEAQASYLRWGATAKGKLIDLHLAGLTRNEADSCRSESELCLNPPRIEDSLDLRTVLKASQPLLSEIVLSKLLINVLQVVMENAGAQRGILILQQEGQWLIEAMSNIASDQATTLQSLPLDSLNPKTQTPYLSNAIAHFVIRNRTILISDQASQDERFLYDPYIQQTQPKSVLCTPLIHQNQCIGLLYLENNITTNVFTPERVEILRPLVSQVAISIENSRLYEQLSSALTSERQARIALQAIEARQSQFLDGVPIGILVVDALGKPYYTNQTAVEILGKRSLDPAHAQPFQDAYRTFQAGTEHPYPLDRLPIVRALQGETVSIDDLVIHQDDQVIPLEISARPIFDPQGQIVYAIAAFQDITQRKKAEAERINLLQTEQWLRQDNRLLQQLAHYDGLTQISNRRRFDDLFALEWGRACREQIPLSVILCDVDFFKAFNDCYGHPAGDDCLKKIAIALENSTHRETDLTARYGGEEFVLLLPNTDLSGAEQVAERAKRNVAALQIEHVRSQVKPQVSISLGYATLIPSPQDDPATLLARADSALYLAKQQGRDRYCCLASEVKE